MNAPSDDDRPIVAFPWYKPSQWQRLVEVSADADKFETSYDAWKMFTVRRMNDANKAGRRAEKVEIDVEELVAWCGALGRQVDRQACAELAAAKLSERLDG